MLLLDGISSWLKFKLILYNQGKEWPEVCEKGKRQSPIGIYKSNAKTIFIPPLEFYHYNNKYKSYIENNGSTICLKTVSTNDCPDLPNITGGCLKGEYILHNIIFKWNSEHTINDKRYPLEIQFIHYNSDYNDIKNAMKKVDGLVILAVLCQTAKCPNTYLDSIINAIPKIAKTIDVKREIREGIVVDRLLPADRNKYYMYKGSITVPECKEYVTWIIFEEITPISCDQLKRLTNIQSETGEPVKENSRPPQNIGSEEVYYISDALTVKTITDYVKAEYEKFWK